MEIGCNRITWMILHIATFWTRVLLTSWPLPWTVWGFVLLLRLHTVGSLHVSFEQILSYEGRRGVRTKVTWERTNAGMAEFMAFALILSQKAWWTVVKLNLLYASEIFVNIPIHALERPLIKMGPNVDQNMISPFVSLFASRDVTAEFFHELSSGRQLSSKGNEPALVILTPLITQPISLCFGLKNFNVDSSMSVENRCTKIDRKWCTFVAKTRCFCAFEKW